MRAQSTTVNAEMNVTPFLDILLVLLVIFLASLQARRTVDVQLPAPTYSTCTTECEAIVLEVLPQRQYALNRTRFSEVELSRHLRAAFDGRPNSIMFVKGADRVRYQDVITAMDIARGAGVKVLAIAPRALD